MKINYKLWNYVFDWSFVIESFPTLDTKKNFISKLTGWELYQILTISEKAIYFEGVWDENISTLMFNLISFSW